MGPSSHVQSPRGGRAGILTLTPHSSVSLSSLSGVPTIPCHTEQMPPPPSRCRSHGVTPLPWGMVTHNPLGISSLYILYYNNNMG